MLLEIAIVPAKDCVQQRSPDLVLLLLLPDILQVASPNCLPSSKAANYLEYSFRAVAYE